MLCQNLDNSSFIGYPFISLDVLLIYFNLGIFLSDGLYFLKLFQLFHNKTSKLSGDVPSERPRPLEGAATTDLDTGQNGAATNDLCGRFS